MSDTIYKSKYNNKREENRKEYIYKTNVEIYFHHLVLFYSKYIVQEKY